jgi:hypothetical protein
MKTRKEALAYGLSFPDTYQEAPFHDTLGTGLGVHFAQLCAKSEHLTPSPGCHFLLDKWEIIW